MQLRYERLSVALFALIAALALVSSVTRAEDAATETLELQPGDNFVGWVAEPIAVADIFEQVPEATLIYTWSADSRSWRYVIRDVGGSLETLQPGMAVNIRIDGRKAVMWERSLTPAKGGVTLYAGVNWVAWNGRDDWPLDQVARGIGTSLVSIEVRGQLYQPDEETTIAPLQRGDALRVTVNRDLRWLQPTGMMPNIVWLGDISELVKENITAETRRLIDFFATDYAIETDFSETTILLFIGIDAVVDHAASGAEPRIWTTPENLRASVTAGQTASAPTWGVFMSACGWQSPTPQPCNGWKISVLAHELFHVLQHQLSVEQQRYFSPVWMTEGTATWSMWQLPSDLIADIYGTREQARQSRLNLVILTPRSLESAESGYRGAEYDLGSLAADLLAEQHGIDSLLEYSRLLHPQSVGLERRWVQTPTWKEAFEGAFGLSATDFYQEFAAWRETLSDPEQRNNYDPNDLLLSGTVQHSDGSPATGFTVIAVEYEGLISVGVERSSVVDDEGLFSLSLPPETNQRIFLEHGSCRLWLTEDGPTTREPYPDRYHDVDTRNIPNLKLTLPDEACSQENELRAKVIRLRDDDRTVQVLLIDAETGAWFPARPGRSGEYIGYAPKPGRYQVRVRLDDCGVFYSEDRIVASSRDADVVNMADDAVSIEFRIPYDLCVYRIRGRIIDQDGNGVGGGWIQMADGRAYSSGDVAADGTFSLEVPASGEYVVFTGTDIEGCYIANSDSGATVNWSRATTITVADSDVTGIEFVVPDDPASLCR